MGKYDGATIEIKNWREFNPRFNSKKPSWFRLEHDIGTGSNLFGLNCEYRWMWIVILCQFSHENGAPIKWNPSYVEAMTGVGESTQTKAIDIFIERFDLKVTPRDSQSNISSPCGSREVTSRDPEGNNFCPKSNISSPRSNISDSHATDVRTYVREELKTEISKIERSVPEKIPVGTSVALAPMSSHPEVGKFIAVYVSAVKAKYGPKTRPDLSGKVQGEIKRFLKDTPLDRAMDLIQVFLQMEDPWFKTKCHDFATFISNLQKIGLALDTGQKTVGRKGIEQLLAEDGAHELSRV